MVDCYAPLILLLDDLRQSASPALGTCASIENLVRKTVDSCASNYLKCVSNRYREFAANDSSFVGTRSSMRCLVSPSITDPVFALVLSSSSLMCSLDLVPFRFRSMSGKQFVAPLLTSSTPSQKRNAGRRMSSLSASLKTTQSDRQLHVPSSSSRSTSKWHLIRASTQTAIDLVVAQHTVSATRSEFAASTEQYQFRSTRVAIIKSRIDRATN